MNPHLYTLGDFQWFYSDLFRIGCVWVQVAMKSTWGRDSAALQTALSIMT